MSTIEQAPPQESQSSSRDVIIDIDALRLDVGLDSMDNFAEKLAEFEGIIREETLGEDVTSASIISGNTTLTVVAGMEAASAGIADIELVDPLSGNSLSFGLDGKIHNVEGGPTVNISLGKMMLLPAGIKVFPVDFAYDGIRSKDLTQVSMADAVEIIPDDPYKIPVLQFWGKAIALPKESVVHLGHGDPLIGVFGAGIVLANHRGDAAVELETGGGRFNRVIAEGAGSIAVGEVVYV